MRTIANLQKKTKTLIEGIVRVKIINIDRKVKELIMTSQLKARKGTEEGQ